MSTASEYSATEKKKIFNEEKMWFAFVHLPFCFLCPVPERYKENPSVGLFGIGQ